MTVEQVVRETQELLKNINVPAGLTEQIAIPISGAIANLQLCLDAFSEQKNVAMEKKQESLVETEVQEIEPAKS